MQFLGCCVSCLRSVQKNLVPKNAISRILLLLSATDMYFSQQTDCNYNCPFQDSLKVVGANHIVMLVLSTDVYWTLVATRVISTKFN